MAPGRSGQAREHFEQFVAEQADGLLRTAYLLIWDLAAAEDLVQETLLRIARRWPRVRSMDHPGAYARRVLVNLALADSRRRTRRRSELAGSEVSVVEDHPDEAASGAFGAIETTSELLSLLGQLSARQRATLVLRYFLDLPEAEVAGAMGCSVGTVKSTASRALQHLRQSQAAGDEVVLTTESALTRKGAPQRWIR